MVFSSILFIFYFLPIFLFCYYLLPFKHATLLFFSLIFYAYGEVIYTYVMLLSILINYAFGLWIAGREGGGRKLALGAGVVVNLGILVYFKYLGFFYEMVAAVAPNLLSGPPQVHLQVVLPRVAQTAEELHAVLGGSALGVASRGLGFTRRSRSMRVSHDWHSKISHG